MEYCYNCGTKLINKELEHEGIVPFCTKCNNYVFPIFSAAVSMIILNEDKSKILLIKQYGKDFYRFVAGYINKGEDAEAAVYREMYEEVGLKPKYIKPLRTKYFDKSNTLMYNFLAVCNDTTVKTNYEIDNYDWIPIEKGKEALKDAKLALYFFEEYLNDNSLK